MMDSIEILRVDTESFRVNVYTRNPFRMIGLIDVNIKYHYGIERVTLAFYRSSGTNDGKILGLWYPIVGIKQHTGDFTEFTHSLNHILTNTTKTGSAKTGWLAKSLFFYHISDITKIRGFSNGIHYAKLLGIGRELRHLYQSNNFQLIDRMDSAYLNDVLTSNEIFRYNHHTQRENYDRFIEDIYDKSITK